MVLDFSLGHYPFWGALSGEAFGPKSMTTSSRSVISVPSISRRLLTSSGCLAHGRNPWWECRLRLGVLTGLLPRSCDRDLLSFLGKVRLVALGENFICVSSFETPTCLAFRTLNRQKICLRPSHPSPTAVRFSVCAMALTPMGTWFRSRAFRKMHLENILPSHFWDFKGQRAFKNKICHISGVYWPILFKICVRIYVYDANTKVEKFVHSSEYVLKS